ncbi:tetratricopeptide repeat protein [Kangiella aquimarina]|uniref:Tetratricopeptide repeat protein n=1 Tax=Kangiella aquimarina TaxID=261965 RepID=A0ABZ0X5C9_9GAMM|nr:tetratricopeptide repeat protein [Kangiella aquimarina]WQG85802.1 hypothetical protein SR900_02685 [Kangiella aquimarina]
MKALIKKSCITLALLFFASVAISVQSLEEKLNEAHRLLTSSPEESGRYLSELEAEQLNLNDNQKERFLLYKGHNSLLQGKHDESILYLNKLVEESKNKAAKAQAYSMLAVVYTNTSEFMNAFVNIEKARLMLDGLTDEKAIKTVLANAATIYTEVGFVDKAYEYSNSYLKEVGKSGVEKELCYAYFNSAYIEIQLQNYEKAQEYFSIALDNCEKSKQKLFHTVAAQEIASLLIMKDNDVSHLESLKNLQDEIQEINWDIAEAGGLIKIAEANLKLKKNEEAVKYAEKAFTTKTTDSYLPHKKEATRILATAYSNLGNNDKAIEYYQLYIDTERQIQLQLKQRKMAYFIAMQSME